MFTPIYLLPQHDIKVRAKYEDRWNTVEGQSLAEKVIEMIRKGGGEDFLQSEFEQGRLDFLESMWDLKGLKIFREEINFPKGDNFEGIDFSYASFYHCKFNGACFPGTVFNFTRFYNCEFINCIFSYTNIYGAILENMIYQHCDFIEHNRLINCECKNVRFQDCFISDNILFDSRLDELSVLDRPREKSVWESVVLNSEYLAEIYKGIKDAYKSGNVIKQSRQYFFEERKALTRHNAKGWKDKIRGYLLEWVTGYGVKPSRVIGTMIAVLSLFSSVFAIIIGARQGLLLSAGAFFTFGANTHYLQDAGTFLTFLYIAESFSGIALMALFITVLANVWFAEK
jgi:hypothetical protein